MVWRGIEVIFFFFQAEDGIRDLTVTGVQTCALPISDIVVGVAEVGIDSDGLMAVLNGVLVVAQKGIGPAAERVGFSGGIGGDGAVVGDRKSTRLNSSHSQISYSVFCLKIKA